MSWMDEECWLWPGGRNKGDYGYVYVKGKTWVAHRLVWTAYRGPIPEGLHIDHLCRVRHCVNPAHMELVSPGENVWRGWESRGKDRDCCFRGHPLDGWHKNGWRYCKTCKRIKEAERKANQCLG